MPKSTKLKRLKRPKTRISSKNCKMPKKISTKLLSSLTSSKGNYMHSIGSFSRNRKKLTNSKRKQKWKAKALSNKPFLKKTFSVPQPPSNP